MRMQCAATIKRPVNMGQGVQSLDVLHPVYYSAYDVAVPLCTSYESGRLAVYSICAWALVVLDDEIVKTTLWGVSFFMEGTPCLCG